MYVYLCKIFCMYKFSLWWYYSNNYKSWSIYRTIHEYKSIPHVMKVIYHIFDHICIFYINHSYVFNHYRSKVLSSWSIKICHSWRHAASRWEGAFSRNRLQFPVWCEELASTFATGQQLHGWKSVHVSTSCFQRRPFWFAAWRKLGKIWYNIVEHDESYTYTIPISRKWRCNVMMLFWRTSRQFPLILRFSLACSVSPLVRHQHT